MRNSNYETDFRGWANEQASLLRSGQLAAADIENIAEEIDGMGRLETRELINRLTVLLTHLLKWKHQPVGRCSSWQTSIRVQRNVLVRHIDDNPSLKGQIPHALQHANRGAILEAAEETKLPEQLFPTSCPWSFEEIIDPNF